MDTNPLRVSSVADADQDHVARLALDVLEVLDEERLELVVGEEVLALGLSPAQHLELVEDCLGLGEAEGRDAEAVLRRVRGVVASPPLRPRGPPPG